MKTRIATALALAVVFCAGCAGKEARLESAAIPAVLSQDAAAVVDPVRLERDEIYTLLAYAVVLKDWQTSESDPKRGHNSETPREVAAGGFDGD